LDRHVTNVEHISDRRKYSDAAARGRGCDTSDDEEECEDDGKSKDRRGKVCIQDQSSSSQDSDGAGNVDKNDGDDDNNSVESKAPLIRKRRKMFTEEEKNAIMMGVKKFGKSWGKIKKEYKITLESRTNVNIKDCYRNMMKNQVADT